jgi:uncharacterized phage protein gp47/JayE
MVIIDDKFSEIIGDAISELQHRTDITQLTPGAKARGLLEIVSRETGNAYDTFDRELLQAFVRYATGEKLDYIGELMGLSRKQASRVELTAGQKIQKFSVDGGRTFGEINGGAPITITAGTNIQTRDDVPIIYTLTDNLVCPAANTEAYGAVKSVDFGIATLVGAGSLTVHDFEQYDDYLNRSLLTTNIEGIVFAEETESDTNYRYRLMNRTLESETGNEVALRIAALSVPGVADVVSAEYARGIGTGAMYIKGIIPVVPESLIADVQDRLDRVKAFGNFVEARSPKNIGVELLVNLTLYKAITTAQDTDLKTRVRQAIFNYINGLDITQPLEISLLVNEIQKVDGNIKTVGTLTKPIEEIYIFKFSASEDNRVRYKLVGDYMPTGFERVVVEYTLDYDPITVRTAVA